MVISQVFLCSDQLEWLFWVVIFIFLKRYQVLKLKYKKYISLFVFCEVLGIEKSKLDKTGLVLE